jgi:hypothetical protein
MTILGKHTLQETDELIRNTEARVDAINVAVLRDSVPLRKADPTVVDDWQAFLVRWTTAKSQARKDMLIIGATRPGVPSVLCPSEEVYQNILHAGSATYPLYGPTDLPGLQDRVAKVSTIQMGAPKQVQSWDFDLSAYQSADSLAKASQAAGAAVKGGIVDTVKANPGTTIMIVGGAVGTLVVLRKLHLL